MPGMEAGSGSCPWGCSQLGFIWLGAGEGWMPQRSMTQRARFPGAPKGRGGVG